MLRRRLETPAEVARDQRAAKLGCTSAISDFFVDGLPDRLSPGGPVPGFGPTVTVCRYLAETPSHDSTFVAGRRLDAGQTRTLLGALALPGRAGPCTLKHTGIVVVSCADELAGGGDRAAARASSVRNLALGDDARPRRRRDTRQASAEGLSPPADSG